MCCRCGSPLDSLSTTIIRAGGRLLNSACWKQRGHSRWSLTGSWPTPGWLERSRYFTFARLWRLARLLPPGAGGSGSSPRCLHHSFRRDRPGARQYISPIWRALAQAQRPETVRQVYATGRPVITNLYKGAVTGRLQISVDVPVFRDGRVVYDLAMTSRLIASPQFSCSSISRRNGLEESLTAIKSIVARTRHSGGVCRPTSHPRHGATNEGCRGGYGESPSTSRVSRCLTASADRRRPAGRW